MGNTLVMNILKTEVDLDTFDPYIDIKCTRIISTFNALPGINVLTACSGRSNSSIWVAFNSNDSKGLFLISHAIHASNWINGLNWSIDVCISGYGNHNNHQDKLLYGLSSSDNCTGDQADRESYEIIRNLNNLINDEEFMDKYDFWLEDFSLME
jgi:hypothetical protein